MVLRPNTVLVSSKGAPPKPAAQRSARGLPGGARAATLKARGRFTPPFGSVAAVAGGPTRAAVVGLPFRVVATSAVRARAVGLEGRRPFYRQSGPGRGPWPGCLRAPRRRGRPAPPPAPSPVLSSLPVPPLPFRPSSRGFSAPVPSLALRLARRDPPRPSCSVWVWLAFAAGGVTLLRGGRGLPALARGAVSCALRRAVFSAPRPPLRRCTASVFRFCSRHVPFFAASPLYALRPPASRIGQQGRPIRAHWHHSNAPTSSRPQPAGTREGAAMRPGRPLEGPPLPHLQPTTWANTPPRPILITYTPTSAHLMHRTPQNMFILLRSLHCEPATPILCFEQWKSKQPTALVICRLLAL